jgi:hypothetical protein
MADFCRPRRSSMRSALALALSLASALAAVATAAAGDQPGDRPADTSVRPPDPAAAARAPRAATASLLYSAQALAMIEAARAGVAMPAVADGTPVGLRRPATEVLHLAAIVHHGEHDWRVWLNGEVWTPATRRATVEIVAVTAESVRLVWRGDRGGDARIVTLAPNQSYRTGDGVVVEGRPRARAGLGWRMP